jgi:hypothetical protein
MTTIVCINPFHKGMNYYNITKCKKYSFDETVNPDHPMSWGEPGYWIIDDNNQQRKLPKECFILLEEWREKQIDSII